MVWAAIAVWVTDWDGCRTAPTSSGADDVAPVRQRRVRTVGESELWQSQIKCGQIALSGAWDRAVSHHLVQLPIS